MRSRVGELPKKTVEEGVRRMTRRVEEAQRGCTRLWNVS